MFFIHFILGASAFAFCAVPGNPQDLPPWITDNKGFQHPMEVNSVLLGNGSIASTDKESQGWLVLLNKNAGPGIEVHLKELNLNPDLNDFLLVSPWPLNWQLKLFTGKLQKPLNKLFIPNTKAFFILYKASPTAKSPKMALNYRRYGSSLELVHPSTDNPINKKETIYEIQLKGRSLDEYSKEDFLKKVKEGMRASARRYSVAHQIPFNDSFSTENMVRIHRISFCPFEWPQRNICISLEHSIFVSGVHLHDEDIILDYQLTADHLKKMWNEDNLDELHELGIAVFSLPSTSSTAIYWSLIVGLIMVSSLLGTFIFRKGNRVEEIRSTTSEFEEKKKIKPNFKLAKHQRVPSFMYETAKDLQTEKINQSFFGSAAEQNCKDESKSRSSPELPIKNYFGSILFSSNRAFEDDDQNHL